MSYFDYPCPPESKDENEYYMLFGKVTDRAVEIYVAFTTEGDDEFDDLTARLNLKYLSHVENDGEAADEWTRYYARSLNDSLPLEIRFMECGSLQQPAVFLYSVTNESSKLNMKDLCCKNCSSMVPEEGIWRSAGSYGHPCFCSRACVKNWYLMLPLTNGAVAAVGA